MKNLFFIIAILGSFSVSARGGAKIDSIYYLIDTAKTPINDRLWEIHEESPSMELYTIQCPCLQFNVNPSFLFVPSQHKQITIDSIELRKIKLVSLVTFIAKTKMFSDDEKLKGQYLFFLIEPSKNKFRIRNVRLLKAAKPYGPIIDFGIVPDPKKIKKN